MSPSLKDRLKQIEASIDTLRDKRAAAAKEQEAAQQAYAGLEDVQPGSPEFEAAKDATRAVGEIDDKIAAFTSEQVEVLRMLGQSPEQIARDKGVPERVGQREAQGWDSNALLSAEGVQERLGRIAASSGAVGTQRLGEVVGRDTFAADIAPTANMRRGDYYGVLPQLQRTLRLLDLIPSGTMDGTNIPYTQESGSFDGAAETAESTAKPEVGVTYTDAEAIARTVAGWMKLPKQALADFPALRSIIDNRLRYQVLRRLEGQILSGNGTAPNLRGVLNTSGIGAVAFDAGQLMADQILSGITQVLLADAMADAIVMHPTDWQTVLKAKAAGDGHYYSGGPFSMTPQVLWGVPLIPSQAIPVGRVLVGDWQIGAQLFVREGIQVLFSDSDGTDFRENRVTLLGEGRFALPVWRPSAFSDVDVAA